MRKQSVDIVNTYVKYMLPGGKSDWFWRRIVVFATITFCFAMTSLCITDYVSDAKATVVVPQLFLLLTFVIGYYVFGPIADDHLKGRGKMSDPGPGQMNPPQPEEVMDQTRLDPCDGNAPVSRGAGQ